MEEIWKDLTVAKLSANAAIIASAISFVGVILVAIINNVSNSRVRKKLNAHEAELETIRNEYAKQLKELEYKYQLKIKEKEAEINRQLEILRDSNEKEKHRQEMISKYLRATSIFFADEGSYSPAARCNFIAAHYEALPLVSEIAAQIMNKILINGAENKYESKAAMINLTALAEQLNQDFRIG